MKTLPKYLSLLLITIGFLSPAFAQRGEHHGGGNQGRGNSGGGQSYSSPRQSNSFSGRQSYSSPRQSSSFSDRQFRQSPSNQPRQNSPVVNRGGGNISSSFSRDRFRDNNNSFVQRGNRGGIQTSTTRVNGSLRGNNTDRFRGNGNARYGYGYGRGGYSSRYGYAPRWYSYPGYRHYSILPRSFISISFGGYPYYYNSGLFYSYYNGFYEPVYAPFGICVSTLPYGYYPFYLGGMPYYYYEGVYYRDHGDQQYEVVDAPMGAVVSTLPKGATVAIINGEKFYEFNGTYYKESTNSNNEVVYTVVGKYGEINNTDEPGAGANQPLKVGDIVTTLPENSRQVTINGQTLFVSPDNFYYKQRTDNGVTSYEVVGTGVKNQ
ncbi:MAG: DUF6515 family protein [Bacteroidota bacterium]|nr:DUF6515 family protein [Bacteroidota bacterium]